MIPQDEGSVPSIDNEESSVQKNPRTFTKFPTFITSSGCIADCEALKRQIRSKIDAPQNWNYGTNVFS